MKKRICFAGFAQAELEALKTAVAGMGSRWECVFLGDSTAVIEAVATKPFDAVVANMQTPGMNGAELLHKVGEVHSATLRMVVGDVSDQALIISAIGGTHQFISRPFTPGDLISTIQRSFGLDAWLSSDQLRAITSRLRRLPSLPSTYFEVLKQVESSNPSMESIGQVIARDPAVTARLLQLVNSAAFSLAQKVTDPVDAVCLLGVETVKSLVLCLQVFTQTDEAKQSGLSLEQIWTHSFAVAQIAREITLRQTHDAGLGNDAFTAGLLHDVGRIVIASNLPKEYSEVVTTAKATGRALQDEEAAQIGVTHAQVGAYLLGLWGMPATLVEAAALHHVPVQSGSREFSILTAVHVANVFAHERDGAKDGLPLPQLDTAYLSALNLTEKVDAWRKPLSGEAPAKGETQVLPQPAPPLIQKPSSAAAQSGTGNNWLIKLFIPATAAAIVIAALVLWKNWSKPGGLEVHAKTPDPVKKESPQPVADPVKKTTTPVRVEPLPPLTAVDKLNQGTKIAVAPAGGLTLNTVKVQGIIFGSRNPSVIVNGKTLFIGECLNGIEVVAIDETNVVLSCNGEKKAFKVK